MQLVVTQDKLKVCCIWKGDVKFFKNKMGIVLPRRTGKLIGRITREFCKRLFGCIPGQILLYGSMWRTSGK